MKAAAVGARRPAWSAASAPEEAAERGPGAAGFLSESFGGCGAGAAATPVPQTRRPGSPNPHTLFSGRPSGSPFFLLPLSAVRTHPRKGGGARGRGWGWGWGPRGAGARVVGLPGVTLPSRRSPCSPRCLNPGAAGVGGAEEEIGVSSGLARNVPHHIQGRSARPQGAAGAGAPYLRPGQASLPAARRPRPLHRQSFQVRPRRPH